MANLHEQLLTAITERNFDEAKRLVDGGIDLNAPFDQGASALYAAILSGDVSLVRLMLERGADPNLRADEPAATIYAENPFELAAQARLLVDWDQFHPVVKLLEEFGATDVTGQVKSNDDFETCERRAREWQASKSV